MHKHTIDWLRGVEISVDVALAERRWKLASEYNVTRTKVIELLRLFLFSEASEQTTTSFTNELLALDPEFPVSNNRQLLRVMAALVMVRSFEKGTNVGDAFALGVHLTRLVGWQTTPSVAAIVEETERYRYAEADRQRPLELTLSGTDYREEIHDAHIDLRTAETAGVPAQISEQLHSYHGALLEPLEKQIERLAEEIQLLWWAQTGYSTALDTATRALAATNYTFPAAAEVVDRISLLPPPPAAEELLRRAIESCRGAQRRTSISSILESTNMVWVSRQSGRTQNRDCRDLVPLCTAIEKFNELRDAAQALTVVKTISPAFSIDALIVPRDASRQYLRELLFLKALDRCED